MSSLVSPALRSPKGDRQQSYFGPRHPLAEVAAHRCERHHGGEARHLIGGVACGSCWETAIRDDEKVVVEFGLPREISADPFYLDEIAIERAMRGEPVSLTPAERVAATERLRARGLTKHVIVKRLRPRLAGRAFLPGSAVAA